MYSKLLLLTAILLSCMACGSGGSTNSNEPKKLKIAVIPKGTTHIFWRSVHAGAAKAAQELDVNIDWQGPVQESDRQRQISIVQTFITRKMDAIVLAPLDSRSLVKVVENAEERKIPVIIFDSGLESDKYTSFVATDNYKGGQLCADRMAELLDKKGKVIMLRYMEGSASTTNREQGFLDRIQEIAPDIELISTTQYAGATLEKGFQASQSLLSRFKEVDGIFCPNETSTQAMLQAMRKNGRIEDDIKFVGFDSNDDLIAGLESEEIDGLAIQDPFRMGYLGVKTAVQHLKGEPIERRVDTGVKMVTGENMKEAEMQVLLKPEIDKWLKE